jgi:protein-S-isoprenylcysteine O-methyltransferase Ste14
MADNIAANATSLSAAFAQAFDRLRKPISFLFGGAILCVVLFTQANLPLSRHIAFDILGMLLTILAALGRVWCAIYIAGHKNSSLCTDGPYSLMRNPLYFFSFLGLVGLLVFAHLGMFALIAALFFLVYHHFVIRSEEIRLTGLFPQEYAAYLSSTSRFWPRFSAYHSRATLTIEPARILKAMSEIVWFLLALGFLETVEQLQIAGIIPVLMHWPF